MAAFFIMKQGKVPMSVLKLQKLLYLSDRESIAQHNFPMTMDRMVSMEHGPVLSRTLDLMNGFICSEDWESLISDRDNHIVSLTSHNLSYDDLDELSRADLAVLEKVWGNFGDMDRWQIRDYTHDHCPEWSDPHGSSKGLPFKDVLVAVGVNKEEAIELDAEIQSMIDENAVFESENLNR